MRLLKERFQDSATFMRLEGREYHNLSRMNCDAPAELFCFRWHGPYAGGHGFWNVSSSTQYRLFSKPW